MDLLIKNISDLVTCRWDNSTPKRGVDQSDIAVISNAFVYVHDGKIVFAGSERKMKSFLKSFSKGKFFEIDATGKTVLPGFVDSHTHTVFAGSRENEYEMRITGKTYEQIAKSGGGILSTVSAVRGSNAGILKKLTEDRLKNFVKYGTTTLEIKSGYGLDTLNELKMLKVIKELAKSNKYGLDILPTFLGAHAVPEGISKKDYVDLICEEMIPEVYRMKLAVFIDAFCEKGYFDKTDVMKIFKKGKEFGLIPKLHTDQFNSIGGVETAIKCEAISVDHLEVIKPEDTLKLSSYNKSGKYMIAALLPGVSYFLDIDYPPARELINKTVPVALATDFNPGSCYTENIQAIMSIASVKLKMTAEEIINAVTYNAACALNIQHSTGSLTEGKKADMCIFDCRSYKDILYHFGVNMITTVIKNGKVINEN